MKLDLRPLLAGDRRMEFAYELAPDEATDPSGFLYGVRFPSPMKVQGAITNTAGYMSLDVSVAVDYQTACARCLAPVSGRFSFDLQKTVATPEMLKSLDESKQDDFAVIEDGFLDLDEQLRIQMEMEFPSRFLCKEDCQGLCPRCGKNRNEGGCSCSDKEVDPRLSPLADLLERMKREEEEHPDSES